MALRFGTNINHHCTITNQIQIAVQIIQLVDCGLYGIYLDCHLFFVMLIFKMRHNHKYRQLHNDKTAETLNLSFLSAQVLSDIGVKLNLM